MPYECIRFEAPYLLLMIIQLGGGVGGYSEMAIGNHILDTYKIRRVVKLIYDVFMFVHISMFIL